MEVSLGRAKAKLAVVAVASTRGTGSVRGSRPPHHAIEQEAATIRRRGYAIEEGEYRRGVHAVAAAVHDRAGEAIAAVGVSSAGRLNVETVTDDIVAVVARLSEALSHAGAGRAR